MLLKDKSKSFDELDGEPEDDLNDRDKADSKTKSTDSTKVGDEV